MIRLIFTDLKNMLKRPLIASLLALGFVVGGFAMLVYFAESTQELKRQNYLFGNENMVEQCPQYIWKRRSGNSGT